MLLSATADSNSPFTEVLSKKVADETELCAGMFTPKTVSNMDKCNVLPGAGGGHLSIS